MFCVLWLRCLFVCCVLFVLLLFPVIFFCYAFAVCFLGLYSGFSFVGHIHTYIFVYVCSCFVYSLCLCFF